MPVGAVPTVQGHDIGPQINALMAREQADVQGFLGLLLAESNLDERARRPVDPSLDNFYWPDVSGGIGQQTVKYAPIGDGSAVRGNIDLVMHVLMTDVDRALDIAAQQYGAHYRYTGNFRDAAAKYNGGGGVTWNDIPAENQANYERGYAAAAAYLVDEVPMPEPSMRAYDPGAPPVRQTDDWSCSVASTTWALQSLGIPVNYPAMEQAMLSAGLVSRELGLLDGSGAALADWLRQNFGVTVERDSYTDWNSVCRRAGQGPIILGGHQLYHWVAVRAVGGEGVLLANPAPNWRNIGDELSRAEFDAWGPWAALWLPVEEPPVDDTQLAYLKDAGRIARENIEAVLAMKGLPKAAREKLATGALPAAQTVERGGPPAD